MLISKRLSLMYVQIDTINNMSCEMNEVLNLIHYNCCNLAEDNEKESEYRILLCVDLIFWARANCTLVCIRKYSRTSAIVIRES